MFAVVRAFAARSHLWARSLSAIALSACLTTHASLDPAASASIVADRPGSTDTPDVVAIGGIQTEGGYMRNRTPGAVQQTLGEGLVRLGVGHRAELRVNVNSYVIDREDAITQRGRQDTKVGTKVAVIERTSDGASLGPAASIELATTIPTGDAALRARGTLPEARLVAAWQLPAGFVLGTNAAYARIDDASARTGQWSGTTALGRGITPWLSAYAEGVGARTTTTDAHGQLDSDGGLALLLGQSTQLDVRAGMRVDGGVAESFFGFGIARRW